MSKVIGVLVMSYGTPDNMEMVEPFFTHIRRGNPPSAEQLQELCDRYEAIGGLFPLKENTNNQLMELEAYLNQHYASEERTFKCYHGMKHVHPFVEDGVEAMVADGIRTAVGIVLAPHYSTMSVAGYVRRAVETAGKHGLQLICVESYHLHPKLIEALVSRWHEAYSQFPKDEQPTVRTIFSAHSLPVKILEQNDPYPDQLLETSRAIAESAGVSDWQFSWQSAGQTAIPWLGPDIQDVLRMIHYEEGIQNVIISPIGFVSDHLEVLCDIDIEAKAVADELGMKLVRTRSLNTDPLYIETLATSVLDKLTQLESTV